MSFRLLNVVMLLTKLSARQLTQLRNGLENINVKGRQMVDRDVHFAKPDINRDKPRRWLKIRCYLETFAQIIVANLSLFLNHQIFFEKFHASNVF